MSSRNILSSGVVTIIHNPDIVDVKLINTCKESDDQKEEHIILTGVPAYLVHQPLNIPLVVPHRYDSKAGPLYLGIKASARPDENTPLVMIVEDERRRVIKVVGVVKRIDGIPILCLQESQTSRFEFLFIPMLLARGMKAIDFMDKMGNETLKKRRAGPEKEGREKIDAPKAPDAALPAIAQTSPATSQVSEMQARITVLEPL